MTETAVVLGDAAIGLFTAQCAKVDGAARVGVVGHHAHSLEIARQVGADFTLNSRDGNTAHSSDPIRTAVPPSDLGWWGWIPSRGKCST